MNVAYIKTAGAFFGDDARPMINVKAPNKGHIAHWQRTRTFKGTKKELAGLFSLQIYILDDISTNPTKNICS